MGRKPGRRIDHKWRITLPVWVRDGFKIGEQVDVTRDKDGRLVVSKREESK